MIKLVPYLMFSGNCEEAMNFYKEVFGGEIGLISRYSEMPGDLPEEYRHKIMHMNLEMNGSSIMAADYAPGVAYTPEKERSGVHLSLGFDTTHEMESCYKKLGETGHITMPIQDTFWGERFAMVTDRYGFNWMLSARIREKEVAQ